MNYSWSAMGLVIGAEVRYRSSLTEQQRAEMDAEFYNYRDAEPKEGLDELVEIDKAIFGKGKGGKKTKRICEMSVGTVFKKDQFVITIQSIGDTIVLSFDDNSSRNVVVSELAKECAIISEPTPQVGDLVERLKDDEWDLILGAGDVGGKANIWGIGPCHGCWNKDGKFNKIPFMTTCELVGDKGIPFICPLRALRILKRANP